MLCDVVDKNVLLVGRTGDENGSGIGKRVRDVLQKFVVFARVTAADRIRLVMDVANGSFGRTT